MGHNRAGERRKRRLRRHRKSKQSRPYKPPLLPIDADANLYVPLRRQTSDRRFSRILERFWEELPAAPKKVMPDFWNANGGERWTASWGPLISLSKDWPTRSLGTAASMDRRDDRFNLRFCIKYFELMPGDVAVVWVAHEFAHVYQLAMGTLDTHQPLTREEVIAHFERDFEDTYEGAQGYLRPETLEGALEDVAHKYHPVEIEAEQIIRSWGFDPDLLEEWRQRVGVHVDAN